MHLTVTTPEKVIIDQEVDEIIVPTTTGEITILPHHVPLVTQLAEGIMLIKEHGREESIALVGGFLEIGEKTITVLADYAVSGKEASATKAAEAKARAEKAMKEAKSEEDFAVAQTEFIRAIQELKVAGRHRQN